MKYLFLLISLINNEAYAALVEDVSVLELVNGESKTEVKFTSSKLPFGNYFFVVLYDNNEKTEDDMSKIMRKISSGYQYILDLNIISFSPYPSGSYYTNYDIIFEGRLRSTSD